MTKLLLKMLVLLKQILGTPPRLSMTSIRCQGAQPLPLFKLIFVHHLLNKQTPKMKTWKRILHRPPGTDSAQMKAKFLVQTTINNVEPKV